MKTNVTFLLDRTGSMQSIKADTIGGFNEFITTLKSSGEEIEFTLLQFDTLSLDKTYIKVPIGSVMPLTDETYQPRSGTPLIDAAYKTIMAVTDEPDTKQVICIQTDGEENASREYTTAQLKKLIEERQAKGWQFMFLGVGIDAYGTASSYGISASTTVSGGRDYIRQSMRASASATVRYAAGTAPDVSYTIAEKMSAGDKDLKMDKTPPAPQPPVVPDFSL